MRAQGAPGDTTPQTRRYALKIHHLNCATFCPPSAKALLHPLRMVTARVACTACHGARLRQATGTLSGAGEDHGSAQRGHALQVAR